MSASQERIDQDNATFWNELCGSQLARDLGITDRSKDVIISGGENISSLEVEDALYRHPAVLTCAVVARPDPKWGETPLAYVDRPDFDDHIDAIGARLPLRRIGQPDDMAGPAVFLLSDDSVWMTGQSLVVDGGYTIQ